MQQSKNSMEEIQDEPQSRIIARQMFPRGSIKKGIDSKPATNQSK